MSANNIDSPRSLMKILWICHKHFGRIQNFFLLSPGLEIKLLSKRWTVINHSRKFIWEPDGGTA